MRRLTRTARWTPALAAGALATVLLAPVSAAAVASGLGPTEAGAAREERALARAEARRAREAERAARRQARRELHAEAHRGASVTCELTLEAGSSVIDAGQAALLAGRLTCPNSTVAGGLQVTLYQKEAGTPGFHVAGSATIGAGSAYQLTLPEVQTNSVFYVRAGAARSPRVHVGVAPVVTLQAAASAASVARTHGASAHRDVSAVTFSGTVTPAYANATVVLERLVPGARRWRLLGKTALSQQGTYSLTHSVGRAGEIEVRAVVHHRGTRATASQTVSYAAAPRQNPRLTIKASANPLAFDEPVTISGTLAGGASRPVVLFVRSPGGAFSEVDQTTTDAHGDYSFPARAPLSNAVYRVDAGHLHSVALREAVAYRITLGPPPPSISAAQPLTITGAVTPAPAGHLYLERQGPALLGFHPVAVGIVGEDGSFSFTHSFPSAGTATLRIAVGSDPQHHGAQSPPFTVQVLPGGEDAVSARPPEYRLAH